MGEEWVKSVGRVWGECGESVGRVLRGFAESRKEGGESGQKVGQLKRTKIVRKNSSPCPPFKKLVNLCKNHVKTR